MEYKKRGTVQGRRDKREDREVKENKDNLGKIKKTNGTGNRTTSKENAKRLSVKLINIQGLSKAKYIELEEMLNEENKMNIICITETQQKLDKIMESKGVTKFNKLRETKDKIGEGLMILHREDERIKLEVVITRSTDILIVKGRVMKKEIRIILVYLDCGVGNEVRVRNR